MSEILTLQLPKDGTRTPDFMADYTLVEENDKLVATHGWINAPNRGDEIMTIIQDELQHLASGRNKTVIHRFEAQTLKGKKLIQRYPDYRWVGRSSTNDPVYEKEFLPAS
ncbi:MAG: hypothetical protein V1810_02390 [Candidatus Beckwithbacteria bacterium]